MLGVKGKSETFDGTLKSEYDIRKRMLKRGLMQGDGALAQFDFCDRRGSHASFRWPGRWFRGGAGS